MLKADSQSRHHSQSICPVPSTKWNPIMFVSEITSLVVIFKKFKMKSSSIPKFSTFPPISNGILPQFCSDDLIQILLKIGLVPNIKNQAILEGFVWNYWSITVVQKTRWRFAPTFWFLARIHCICSFDLSDEIRQIN